MFVFTKIKTGEWNLFTKENNIFYTAEAQTEKILCGSILNRSDEEYYVLAYQMQEDNASLYQSIIEKYNSSSRKISLYQLDLSNSRNNICLSDNLSITNDVSTLKLVVPNTLAVSFKRPTRSFKEASLLIVNLSFYSQIYSQILFKELNQKLDKTNNTILNISLTISELNDNN